MRIAITGANGFIGGELVKHFLAKGDEVLLMQRTKPVQLAKETTYLPYDLNEPDALILPDGIDAFIHAAYMPYTPTNNASSVNIKATLALYTYCIGKGIQFVFFSSMSAHANALSEYGKHKFELEKQLDSSKCLILKLGLVIGKDGLFSRIYDSFSKMPFAILVGGGEQPVQPIYIGDVVNVIDKCVTEKRTGIYTMAVNKVYTMHQLFSAIAAKAGKKPLFISVPYGLVEFGIGVIAALHLPFPVSKENLLGLKQLQAINTSADIDKLGISLLDLKESIDLL